jgi:RNA polymerase sigma factor (sigma-70 family)
MAAVVLGTAFTACDALGAGSARSDITAEFNTAPDAVRDITRYCQVCWRNARLPVDRWEDCTQMVFSRLLERVAPARWAGLVSNVDGEDRREFLRAIDAVKKRTQRSRRFAELSAEVADGRHHASDHIREQREAVDLAAAQVLSPRQRKIVELSADGWAVPEIATELRTTPERVSDEKYKAIRKLRTHLAVDA